MLLAIAAKTLLTLVTSFLAIVKKIAVLFLVASLIIALILARAFSLVAIATSSLFLGLEEGSSSSVVFSVVFKRLSTFFAA